MIWPVTQELSFDKRNLDKLAASEPSPILFKGCSFAIVSSVLEFLITLCAIFDFDKLGAIQFTLMLGASSAAKATVKPSTPDLADEIILWLMNPFLAATVENSTIEALFFF